MLLELEQIPDSVSVLLIYVTDDAVKQYIQDRLNKRYKLDKNYIVDVVDNSMMTITYKDALLHPLLGDRWCIRVDLDKVSVDAVIRQLLNVNENSIMLLYTKDYRTFNKLRSLDKVTQNNTVVRAVYGGALSSKDMYVLYQEQVSNGALQMPQAVLSYVVQQYKRDVLKYIKILQALKSQVPLNSRVDVVNTVGLGALTVEKLLVDVLKTEIKTAVGRKRALNRWMQMLYDLQQVMSTVTLIQQMRILCIDMLNLKLLHISGYIIGNRREIPKSKDTVGLRKLEHYADDIFEKITVPKILWFTAMLNNESVSIYASDAYILNVFLEIAVI
jgi:hypothetical protein